MGRICTPVKSTVVEVNDLHAAIYKAGQELMQAEEYRRATEVERQSLLKREQGARQLAEAQNRAKDQFLAMLGHELRNPLAPISNAADILQHSTASPERVQQVTDNPKLCASVMIERAIAASFLSVTMYPLGAS